MSTLTLKLNDAETLDLLHEVLPGGAHVVRAQGAQEGVTLTQRDCLSLVTRPREALTEAHFTEGFEETVFWAPLWCVLRTLQAGSKVSCFATSLEDGWNEVYEVEVDEGLCTVTNVHHGAPVLGVPLAEVFEVIRHDLEDWRRAYAEHPE